MSAGFTPGPWSYARNPENTRWIIDGAPNRAIACTAGYEPDNEANANLIAAAPDLYEALEAAREWLSGWASAEPYIETIDAALAKARGDRQ